MALVTNHSLRNAAGPGVALPHRLPVKAAVVACEVLRRQRRNVREVGVERRLHRGGEGGHGLREVLGLPGISQDLAKSCTSRGRLSRYFISASTFKKTCTFHIALEPKISGIGQKLKKSLRQEHCDFKTQCSCRSRFLSFLAQVESLYPQNDQDMRFFAGFSTFMTTLAVPAGI